MSKVRRVFPLTKLAEDYLPLFEGDAAWKNRTTVVHVGNNTVMYNINGMPSDRIAILRFKKMDIAAIDKKTGLIETHVIHADNETVRALSDFLKAENLEEAGITFKRVGSALYLRQSSEHAVWILMRPGFCFNWLKGKTSHPYRIHYALEHRLSPAITDTDLLTQREKETNETEDAMIPNNEPADDATIVDWLYKKYYAKIDKVIIENANDYDEWNVPMLIDDLVTGIKHEYPNVLIQDARALAEKAISDREKKHNLSVLPVFPSKNLGGRMAYVSKHASLYALLKRATTTNILAKRKLKKKALPHN